MPINNTHSRIGPEYTASRMEPFVETAVPALVDLVSLVLFCGMVAVFAAIGSGA